MADENSKSTLLRALEKKRTAKAPTSRQHHVRAGCYRCDALQFRQGDAARADAERHHEESGHATYVVEETRLLFGDPYRPPPERQKTETPR